MTLAERRADAQARSVALYLKRQQVEQQRQYVLTQAQVLDQELLTLDGEIRAYDALIAAEKAPNGQ